MTFKSIATLAGDVLRNVEIKRAGANPAKIEAARQHTGGMDDEPLAQDTPAHPVSGVEGSAATGLGMGKKAGAGKAPASSDRGGTSIQLPEETEVEMDAYRTHMRPALRLVTGGRELRSDYRRRVEGFPDPALRNSLKLVGGTDHARSFSRTG